MHKFSVHKGLNFNTDETMLAAEHRKVKVYCGVEKCRGVRSSLPIGSEEHISILITICADGSYMKPLFILPLKNLPDNLVDLI